MKLLNIVLSLAAVVSASPIASVEVKRQLSSTSNELELLPCRPYIFIFARGSTEPGNMGTLVGPPTCAALKNIYGSTNVACQGVGGAYLALLGDNLLPGGTSPAAFAEAARMFNLANSKCPGSIVVGGGYSQGAAVMRAITGLTATVKAQIAGVVLYGDTRNAQTGGSIPGYPLEDTRVFCAIGDGVCGGALIVTAAHLSYGVDVPAAAAFLQSRISAAG